MPTNSSEFAGLRFSYAFPLRDSTHSPLMKFLNIRGATAVAILPPPSVQLAGLLFVRSCAGLNARHLRRGNQILPSRVSPVKFLHHLVVGQFPVIAITWLCKKAQKVTLARGGIVSKLHGICSRRVASWLMA